MQQQKISELYQPNEFYLNNLNFGDWLRDRWDDVKNTVQNVGGRVKNDLDYVGKNTPIEPLK